MKDILDVHTHTIASGHAYSTLREMITAAKEKGMEMIGIADHSPGLPGGTHPLHFCNFKVIPRDGYGIDLVMGIELNIVDYAGSTDLCAQFLKRLDYAIASLHSPCIDPGTKEENTSAILGAMRNPRVNIIGHPDNPQYEVDFDRLAKAAKEEHVLLELNNSSYRHVGSRAGSEERAVEMLKYCRKYGTEVILGSDAHIDFDAGEHSLALEILKDTDFPEELVVNSSKERFYEYIR